MTIPPPPSMPQPPGATPPDQGTIPMPEYPSFPPPAPGIPPPPMPPKRNGPLIVGVIAGVLALCLLGTCGIAVAAVFFFNNREDQQNQATGDTDLWPSPTPRRTGYPAPSDDEDTDPPNRLPTTQAPPPPPAKIGQCIVVSEQGDFQGIGNCNGSRGTYRVVSVDYEQNNCANPKSGYLTEDGYRLCLERHLVRFYCYKFPKGSGWIVGAACKAKGTVHIIDIVPGASNDRGCTRDYKWNRWYRFTDPVVVYCVMQY
ncbi:hypothetical protein ACWDV4_29365 [Micromonospora sp. NPDC003197]